MRPLPPHTDAAHLAITTELVRLTLPHHPDSDRPALEAEVVDAAFTTSKPRRKR